MKDQKYNEVSQKVALPEAEAAITAVDIYEDNTRVAAASKDKYVYIFDLKARKMLDKVCFKYKPDMKNMTMRDCLFGGDGALYTLAVEPRQPSYLIKWKPHLGNY